MNWNAIFYSAVAIAAFAIFLIPFSESAMSPGFVGLFSRAGLAATATFLAVAIPTFTSRKGESNKSLFRALDGGIAVCGSPDAAAISSGNQRAWLFNFHLVYRCTVIRAMRCFILVALLIGIVRRRKSHSNSAPI
jgi:hypothetical protein